MKTYLVDTENVGGAWINLLENISPKDRICLFITDESAKLSLADLQYVAKYANNIEVIECFRGTENAMDFQLCTVLGHKAHNSTKSEFVIVSNDNGYDPVVAMMLKRGRNVKRITMPHIHKEQVNPVIAMKKVIVENGGMNIDAKRVAGLIGYPKNSDDTIRVIDFMNKSPDLATLHANLRQWKGERGAAIYRDIKPYYSSLISKKGV